MSKIIFNRDELRRIGDEWKRFFQGELDKPMIFMGTVFSHFDEPKLKQRKGFPMYPPEISAEEIIDIEDACLGCRAFVGDTYPCMSLNFGPGSLSSYFGARHEVTDSVWFFPTAERLEDIPEKIDTGHWWYQRILDLLDAAGAKWASTPVQVGGSDMGNNLDVLAELRGNSELALDLVDEPELVKQKLRAITAAWRDCYQREYEKIAPITGYSTAALGALSERKTARLQSDFGYMISPAMFEEFVIPDILALCDFLDDPCYHLDGIPQLQHLPFILNIPKIRAIEFVHGAGQKPPCEWTHVYKQIHNAGKQCLLFVNSKDALDLKRAMGGTLRGFGLYVGDFMTVDEARDVYRQLVS